MAIQPILFWLPMILLAFANAAIRQVVLVKHFNELEAHQLSTFTLTLLCGIYIAIIFPYLAIESISSAFFTGLLWMLLTIIFECTLARITGHSWSNLLQNYNLLAGRIWPLFLLALLLLPIVWFIIRQ